MLQVRCPKCRKIMNYDPKTIRTGGITSKSKRCVYCGHTFKVHSNQEKSRIVKIIRQ